MISESRNTAKFGLSIFNFSVTLSKTKCLSPGLKLRLRERREKLFSLRKRQKQIPSLRIGFRTKGPKNLESLKPYFPSFCSKLLTTKLSLQRKLLSTVEKDFEKLSTSAVNNCDRLHVYHR